MKRLALLLLVLALLAPSPVSAGEDSGADRCGRPCAIEGVDR